MVKYGKLEVICGPMFSGKTTEMLRLLRIAEITGYKTMIFRANIDVRRVNEQGKTHDNVYFNAKTVNNIDEILEYAELDMNLSFIAIEEGQFFGDKLFEGVKFLLENSFEVIVTGLLTDWQQKSFKNMLDIIAIADKITHLKSICLKCRKNEAVFTKRKDEFKNTDRILVGSGDMYYPCCRDCFTPLKF